MKNKIFIVPIEIIKKEVLVCVGVDEKYFDKWCKVRKLDKNFKEAVRDLDRSVFKEKGGTTLTMECEESKQQFDFIFLDDYDNKWNCLTILLHEVIHLKQFIFKDREIRNEIEFEAYFIETVFKKIREQLNEKLK